MVLCLYSVSFPSVPKPTFSVSCRGGSIATEVGLFVLTFVYLKISILPSFLKDDFAGYRILD